MKPLGEKSSENAGLKVVVVCGLKGYPKGRSFALGPDTGEG